MRKKESTFAELVHFDARSNEAYVGGSCVLVEKYRIGFRSMFDSLVFKMLTKTPGQPGAINKKVDEKSIELVDRRILKTVNIVLVPKPARSCHFKCQKLQRKI